ncbi:MAG: hypothetical protein PHC97_04020 [Patescibacteria group bacterium]|nr:hypothetical protein [Patescibacteria group bacterium]
MELLEIIREFHKEEFNELVLRELLNYIDREWEKGNHGPITSRSFKLEVELSDNLAKGIEGCKNETLGISISVYFLMRGFSDAVIEKREDGKSILILSSNVE